MSDHCCPLDRRVLRPITYEGVTIHTCDDCGGELVTPDALVHIIYVREETFSAELLSELEDCTPTPGIPEFEQERQIDCPCCGTGMSILNYTSDTGVIIDKCPTCGAVWLDNDELEKAQALLERWQDEAPERIRSIAGRLEDARKQAEEDAGGKFSGSRFGFVNAMINRLLDAA